MSFSPDRKATIVAMGTAATLATAKLVVGIVSGSMAVLASATDSLGDFFVSLINFLAVGKSETPEDEDHNYGHGKVEGFAALFEGCVIGGSALFLIFLSVKKYIAGTGIEKIEDSLFVMIFSIITTALLLKYLRGIIKKTGSLIIRADELHYRTDLITNASVLVSLFIIRLSGWMVVDLIVSVLISLYIIKSAFEILREGYRMLMDESISPEQKKIIIDTITSASKKVHGFHCLRTRTSGKTVFIEVHVVFSADISLVEAHDIADAIEKKLSIEIPWSIATIHLDPYDDNIKD